MPPTPADYAGLWKMYFLAKEYFRFLYGGVKESFNEWRDKNLIRRAIIQDGHQMTYRDLVLFRRVKSNNRRCVLTAFRLRSRAEPALTLVRYLLPLAPAPSGCCRSSSSRSRSRSSSRS